MQDKFLPFLLLTCLEVTSIYWSLGGILDLMNQHGYLFRSNSIFYQSYHNGECFFVNVAFEVVADLKGAVQSFSGLLLFVLAEGASSWQWIHAIWILYK